jgi:hypothetical protein
MIRVNAVHLLMYAERYVKPACWGDLETWWTQQRAGVCVLTGIGGCGKTATVDRVLRENGVLGRPRGKEPPNEHVFIFSFSEGTPELLGRELSTWVGEAGEIAPCAWDAIIRQTELAAERVEGVTLVLDALEHIQDLEDTPGRIEHPGLRRLLERTANGVNRLAVLATSRYPVADAQLLRQPLWLEVPVEPLGRAAAVELLRLRGISGTDAELTALGERFSGHPLTLDLVRPDLAVASEPTRPTTLPGAVREVLAAYVEALRSGPEPQRDRLLVDLLCGFPSGASPGELTRLAAVFEVGLTADGVGASRETLQALGLIRSRDREKIVMHQLVREFFDEQLEAERAETIHRTRVLDLTARLGDQTLPLVEQLDAGEEAVWHYMRLDAQWAAFEFYWRQIGNFSSLGHDFGEYVRGERICRVINRGRLPKTNADGLAAPPGGAFADNRQNAATAFMTDWSLYLQQLGQIELAAAMIGTTYFFSSDPTAAVNVAELHLLRGGLPLVADYAHSAIERAKEDIQNKWEGMPVAEAMKPWTSGLRLSGTALLLMGEVESAAKSLRESAELAVIGPMQAAIGLSGLDVLGIMGRPPARDDISAARASLEKNLAAIEPIDVDPRFAQAVEARAWGEYLDRRGAHQAARTVLEAVVAATGVSETSAAARARALLGHILLNCGEVARAEQQIDWLRQWLGSRDARLMAAELALLETRAELARRRFASAWERARDGLVLARDCGLALLHIELLNARARAALDLGDAGDARYCAATALWGHFAWRPGAQLYSLPTAGPPSDGETPSSLVRGIFPPENSGRPALLAACDHRCRYAWGELDARELEAEASLLEVAQAGEGFDGAATVRGAVSALEAVLARRRALSLRPDGGDPAIATLRVRLEEISAGRITRYPLSPFLPSARVGPNHTRVMVSYSHIDSSLATKLADTLEERISGIWIDRRSIQSGDSIVSGINQALSQMTDYVLVFSKSSAASTWVKLEWETALYLMNQTPGRLQIHLVLADRTPLPAILRTTKALDVASLGVSNVAEALIAAIGQPPMAGSRS